MVNTSWYISPGIDGGFYRGVLQTTAKWITTGPLITVLRQGTPTVRTDGSQYIIGGNPNPLTGLIDPLIPITETPTGKILRVRIPIGTTTNGFFGGVDASQPYIEWNAFLSSINTGSIQASGSTVSCNILLIADGTGRILEDIVTGQPPHDDAIGQMPEFELLAAVADPNYYIPHKMTYGLDPRQYSNSTIWPLPFGEVNGTGTIPQGYTIGIPFGTVRPTGKTRGYYLLFDTLYAHGAYYYNGSTTNAIAIPSRPESAATQALAADMNTQFPAIMQIVCILSADGTLGSQFNVATIGGKTSSTDSPVVPQPPPMDYSPTGGLAVLPSTFSAWYPSGYNVPSVASPPSTSSNTGSSGVRSNTSHLQTGYYVEHTVQALTPNIFVGFANAAWKANTNLGSDFNSCGLRIGTQPLSLWINNVKVNANLNQSVQVGTTISMAADFTQDIVSFRANNGPLVSQNTSSILPGPYFVAASSDGSGSLSVVNFPFITPGVGTFTDSLGRLWNLDSGGNVIVNGVPVPGGGGTDAMEYVAPTVYARDGGNGNWFTTDGSTFNGPVTAPPVSTGGVASNAQITTNFGATPFKFTIPIDYSQWQNAPPIKPIITSIGSITSTSVVVNWTKSNLGSNPIFDKIMYSVHNNNTWVQLPQQDADIGITGVDTLTQQIIGLQPTTQYDFTVFANNLYGFANSTIFSATTTTPTTNIAFGTVSGFIDGPRYLTYTL